MFLILFRNILWQGSPLNLFLFVLAVEILALKLRHDPDCKGIILPNSREARLTQFADDTTVISSSVASLKASLQTIASVHYRVST